MRKATSCKIQGMSRRSIPYPLMYTKQIVFTIIVDTVDTGLNYIVHHSTKSLNYNIF